MLQYNSQINGHRARDPNSLGHSIDLSSKTLKGSLSDNNSMKLHRAVDAATVDKMLLTSSNSYKESQPDL